MDEIMELWEELKFEVGTIGNELIPKDKRTVLIGMGNRQAPILFIGNDSNLYIDEDYKVLPNSTGEFLLKLLDIVEINPDDFYITTLSKREAKFKYFDGENGSKLIDLIFMQIALINPKIIVFLGKEAAQNVLGREVNFDEERGQFQKWRGNIEILLTYEVETVVKSRNMEGKKSVVAINFWNDIKELKKELSSNE